MLFEASIAVSVLIVCLIFKWQYSYWTRRKIDGPPPYPIFGNMFDYVITKKHFGLIYDEIYNSYPSARYVGFYKMSQPAILIRDLDLVKDILVKDFSAFHDNDFTIDPKADPLLASSPFFKSGDDWKGSRHHVAPLFTSAKIKQIFPLTKHVCDKLLEYIECGPESRDMDGFDSKELCSKFTIDNIASCAFGVEGDAFTNPKSKFYNMARSVFNNSWINKIRNTLALFLPFLTNILPISYISRDVDRWVRKLTQEVVNIRKENHDFRQDFFQAILHLKEKGEINDETMMGHSLLFLTEGFETSSTLMAYALYQIAINPHVQRRLHQEIDEVIKKHNGELTDEGLNELRYMEKVFLETLRIHPPVFSIGKLCTKPYELPPQYADSKVGVTVPIGTPVILPVYSIHLDPNIYDKPFIFDPDRFTDENKLKRHKYSFLGFGEGPRICLGAKFAMMQSKMAIATILTKYDIHLTEKTIEPLSISSKTLLLYCDNGIWLKFTKRNKK